MFSRNRSTSARSGFAWLELLLVLAIVALMLQLIPQWGVRVLESLDFRNWSRSVWFGLNLLMVLGAVGIRFAPELAVALRTSRKRGTRTRPLSAEEEQRKLKEERELYARMIKARQRQV